MGWTLLPDQSFLIDPFNWREGTSCQPTSFEEFKYHFVHLLRKTTCSWKCNNFDKQEPKQGRKYLYSVQFCQI